jgi:RimJ/RimL family protein N-acetyltransferase
MPLGDTFMTARLRAERLSPDDLEDLVRLHHDPAVMAGLGGVRDRQQTAEYLARNLSHWSEFGFGVWMLREVDGNEIIGRAALRHLDVEGADEIEIGFAFQAASWGRGLATEVGETCVELARHDLRATSLVGITTLANHASQRVLTKLGFEREREVAVQGTPCILHRLGWLRSGSS